MYVETCCIENEISSNSNAGKWTETLYCIFIMESSLRYLSDWLFIDKNFLLYFLYVIYYLSIISLGGVLIMDANAFIDMCNKGFKFAEVDGENKFNGCEEVYKQAGMLMSEPRKVLGIIEYLRQKLIIFHHKNNLDYLKYTPVLYVIQEVARRRENDIDTTSVYTDWERLVSLIIKNKKHFHQFSEVKNYRVEDKYHNFALSYIRLRSLGVEFTEKDFHFYIAENSHSLITNKIDEICKAYGGERLLNTLAEWLGKTYNPIAGRFMEYRHVSFGGDSIKPAIPFGYLLAIASKYNGVNGYANSNLFNQLLLLVSDIIVVYEIQPYSLFEAMYLRDDAFISFIRNNLLYDSFVGIPQINSSHATSLIKYLKLTFKEPCYISHNIKVKDLIRISLALISCASNKKFCDINAKEIAKKANIPEYKVTLILDKVLSFPSEHVNAYLRFPPISTDINHFFKPVIKTSKAYKVYPKSIASLGCLNTICNFISFPNGKWSNKIDSELGYAVENFLREAFVGKGIEIAYGDRLNGDVKLEVDLLCETDDCIYIFEMKKKGLTRQAQSGNESHILSDLADSVLRSHYQAMRIENVLNNCEFLHLKHNDVESSITLKGRRVIRISVSLLDFGALQDKTVLQRLLTIAINNKFSSEDENENKKLEKWREYSEKLGVLAFENKELGDGRVPFHNSLFMSIPQILFLLDKSNDAGEFFKYLRFFISTTTGSRDVYTDFLSYINILDQSEVDGGHK